MIPAKFHLKIGIHEVEIEGLKVKASHVPDNSSVLEPKINQLRASLDKQRPVVGVDFKVSTGDPEKQQDKSIDLLILFGGNCCLVINLVHLSTFPQCLLTFLANNNICFVGTGLHDKLGCSSLRSRGGVYEFNTLSLKNVVEVGDLAARVLKKPNLTKCQLHELDNQVRKSAVATDLPDQTCLPGPDSKASMSTTTTLPGTSGGGANCANWKAMVFTDEEIKNAILDAYTCCVIGDKLLGILDAVNL